MTLTSPFQCLVTATAIPRLDYPCSDVDYQVSNYVDDDVFDCHVAISDYNVDSSKFLNGKMIERV